MCLFQVYPVSAFFFYWSYALFILYFTLNMLIGIITAAFEQAREQQDQLIGDASWWTLCVELYESWRHFTSSLVGVLQRLHPKHRRQADNEVLCRWMEQWPCQRSPLRFSLSGAEDDGPRLSGAEDEQAEDVMSPRPSASLAGLSAVASCGGPQPDRHLSEPKWYWFSCGGWVYGNSPADLCKKLVSAPPVLTYRQLEVLLDTGQPKVKAPYHTVSALYTMLRSHTPRVYREYQAAEGAMRGGGTCVKQAHRGPEVEALEAKVEELQCSLWNMEVNIMRQLQAMRNGAVSREDTLLTMRSGRPPSPMVQEEAVGGATKSLRRSEDEGFSQGWGLEWDRQHGLCPLRLGEPCSVEAE